MQSCEREIDISCLLEGATEGFLHVRGMVSVGFRYTLGSDDLKIDLLTYSIATVDMLTTECRLVTGPTHPLRSFVVRVFLSMSRSGLREPDLKYMITSRSRVWNRES